MMTGKAGSLWFAPLVALLMVVSLSGCFNKEGEQRKAFIDFLQNTALHSGDRLPALTSDQRKQFGPLVSDYAILYGFSQQVSQAMDEGMKPVVASVNSIHAPQDFVTQRDALRQANDSLNALGQKIQNAKMQADEALAALKQPDDLKTVYAQVYQKAVTGPATAMVPLIPAAQALTHQLVQVGDFIVQQNNQVGFADGGIEFPTSEQASEYNTLIAPLLTQQQSFNEAYNAAQDAMK